VELVSSALLLASVPYDFLRKPSYFFLRAGDSMNKYRRLYKTQQTDPASRHTTSLQ
jgi:hypothetical protein